MEVFMHQITEKSLCFSQSPLCPLAADVISDGHSIYFYLYDLDYEQHQLIAHSACWVKNISAAPSKFDEAWIQDDKQPILPSFLLRYDHPYEPWDATKFEIVWSKEGDMAGLFYEDCLVSAIPDWANPETFCGYSRYVQEDCAVGFTMRDVEVNLRAQLQEGKAFWKQEFNGVWQLYHSAYVQGLKQRYGNVCAIYDLHQGQFPSRLLATFEDAQNYYAFTIGVGMFAMPHVSVFYEDYQKYNHNEFGIALSKENFTKEDSLKIYNDIAQLCDYPWSNFTCFLDSHTIDVELSLQQHCIFVDDDRYEDCLVLPFKEENVHLLWLKGLTEQEYSLYHVQEDKEGFMQYIASKGRIN